LLVLSRRDRGRVGPRAPRSPPARAVERLRAPQRRARVAAARDAAGVPEHAARRRRAAATGGEAGDVQGLSAGPVAGPAPALREGAGVRGILGRRPAAWWPVRRRAGADGAPGARR